MLACGAEDAIIVDAKDALAEAGIRLVQCQAMYEGGYWNTTGIATACHSESTPTRDGKARHLLF